MGLAPGKATFYPTWDLYCLGFVLLKRCDTFTCFKASFGLRSLSTYKLSSIIGPLIDFERLMAQICSIMQQYVTALCAFLSVGYIMKMHIYAYTCAYIYTYIYIHVYVYIYISDSKLARRLYLI